MDNMYKVECLNLRAAVKAIYRFMTNPLLIRPECTIWDKDGISSTIVNTGVNFMPESDLLRRIIRTEVVSISCVAATDLADTRRVAFAYMTGLDFMVLTFPQSNGKLSDEERKIVEDMRNHNELFS